MATFKTRIKQISKKKGRIILANDYDLSVNLESKTITNIKNLSKYLCAIKFNFPQLLPLGIKELTKINKIAHEHDLQTIADIKLNDIVNTNQVTLETLWKLGFDAVIVNPIMGVDALKKIVNLAHQINKGVISLCHMSSPEAQLSYEMTVKTNQYNIKLYQLFLNWALSAKVDGIIVGATFPNIIKSCHRQSKGKLDIYSPGVGTQGGKVGKTIDSGSDFLIVGRTILYSKNPIKTSKELQQLSLCE